MRHEKEPETIRVYICANCHCISTLMDGMTLVRIENFYFHSHCPKIVRPFPKKEEEKKDEPK